MPASFAVVETGGKQYRVAAGDTIDVELLPSDQGAEVTLDRVLMVGGDDGVTVGSPTVEGASVKAEVVGHDRAKKIIVFKYKNKVRYRRKTGHRQGYTRLHIQEINLKQTAARRKASSKRSRGAAPASLEESNGT